MAFVPFQKNTAQALRALDVVVHASTKPEPFGRTIAEAIACERAVIVAEAGGAKEVVDASTACLIEPGSPEALARAIVDLAKNPDKRATLARNGRAHAVAHLSRTRLADDVLTAYASGGIDVAIN
jgi:glycosyltransferase involved in cell wall biosynthesis